MGIFLNTIISKSCDEFYQEYIQVSERKKEISKEDVLLEIVAKFYEESKFIIFNGNGYSDSWKMKSRELGIVTFKNTYEVLKVRLSQKNIKLFSEMQVLTEKEVNSKYHIELEEFINKSLIEYDVLSDMAHSYVIPPAIRYLSEKKIIFRCKHRYQRIR